MVSAAGVERPGCAPAATLLDPQGRFERTYARDGLAAERAIELASTGSDHGANGYATRAEIDEMAGLLELGPEKRLLDIGSGRGWPGLYLASQTGCSVVVTDLTHEGTAAAARRAARDAVRAWGVLARAEALPLRAATFDAVVHADVLCCLPAKGAALRRSRQTLRPGGRTAFGVIHLAPGLTAADQRRAVAAGPPHGAVRTSYVGLLRSAGFVEIEHRDVSDDYLATARRKLVALEEHADAMSDALGAVEFEFTRRRRAGAVDAISDGLLQRSIFVARRAGAIRSARR